MADVAALLAAYDDQVRPSEARNLPAGAYAEADGPIVRVVGLYQGFVSAPAELTLDGDELDALIARQREFFASRGEAVEWKTRAHDRPDDLPDRLVARRAQFAAARGVRFLQVDASDDSRPSSSDWALWPSPPRRPTCGPPVSEVKLDIHHPRTP
jgi:hypothetical protein